GNGRLSSPGWPPVLFSQKFKSSLRGEFEFDNLRRFFWPGFEFALRRRFFGLGRQHRMAADDVCSLHLAVDPDSYLDFHETRKTQLFGKVRILRSYKHFNLAFRLWELCNLSAGRNCPTNGSGEYG